MSDRLRRAWRRAWAVAESATHVVDREDVPALCGLAGAVCLVRGAALVYAPAGWLVAGALLLAFYARRA